MRRRRHQVRWHEECLGERGSRSGQFSAAGVWNNVRRSVRPQEAATAQGR
jgi:hypothetical protein